MEPDEKAAVPRLAPDAARIRAKSDVLKETLRGCGGRELEMLIRYYTEGQDLERVAAEMDASPKELEEIISRLRGIASRVNARGAGAAG